jgi:hypothetical protein
MRSVEIKPVLQFTTMYPLNRGHHIWHNRDGVFKCVLCGAITMKPADVTSGNLNPERYERLTEAERALAPLANAGVGA